MADQEQKFKEHFEKNLKAVDYNKVTLEYLHQDGSFFEFMFGFLHDVIHSGRFNGTKVLEIGSGATVYGIASASAVFPNIVQGDFVTDNREELKKWLKGDSPLDWSEFLKIIVRLEGNSDDTDVGVQLLEERIRKSVKCVVKTDVLSDSVLPLDELKTVETKPPYDLIITCLCLETASPDYDAYVNSLKRISKLIRPGGGLIICGFEMGGYWNTGDSEFPHLLLSMDDILNALKSAGFAHPHFKKLPKPDKELGYGYEYIFGVTAEKL